MSIPDTNWRQGIWKEMMANLPASIIINMNTQSYLVKDNSLQYVYSDDIDEAGVDVLIDEVSRELPQACRDDFKNVFSMKVLKQKWSEGKDRYALLSRMGSDERVKLRTDVIFDQNRDDMFFELRFDVCLLSDYLGGF